METQTRMREWEAIVREVLGREPMDLAQDAEEVRATLGLTGIGPTLTRRLLMYGHGLPAAS